MRGANVEPARGRCYRICCTSDLHGRLPSITDCDLLLLAGDVVPTWAHDPEIGRGWLDTNFRSWLVDLEARGIAVVGVAGNHDFVMESELHHFIVPLPWTYLEDSGTTFGGEQGVLIYGSPWQPYFGGWAFNLDEERLADRWEMIPHGLDVLLLHGPPYLHGDRTDDGLHVGSPSLLQSVHAKKPRVVVSGHIHSGYGVEEDAGTLFVNCAYVGEDYRPRNRPVLLDLDGDDVRVVDFGPL